MRKLEDTVEWARIVTIHGCLDEGFDDALRAEGPVPRDLESFARAVASLGSRKDLFLDDFRHGIDPQMDGPRTVYWGGLDAGYVRSFTYGDQYIVDLTRRLGSTMDIRMLLDLAKEQEERFLVLHSYPGSAILNGPSRSVELTAQDVPSWSHKIYRATRFEPQRYNMRVIDPVRTRLREALSTIPR